KKVLESGRRTPSTVTARSCIASSNADWVRGGVRLSSSARSTSVKTGPATKENSCRRGSKTLVPRRSTGIRSGGELDPPERTPDQPGEGQGDEGLPGAGCALEEHVTAGEERGEHLLLGRRLTEHDPVELGAQAPPALGHQGKRRHTTRGVFDHGASRRGD